MSTQRALYVYGVFDSPDQSTWKQLPKYVADMTSSAFNTVILSTFHVDANGNLFGSAPLVTDGVFNRDHQLYGELPALYEKLASHATLYYSVGNWAGSEEDLTNLQAILRYEDSDRYATLRQNLQVLARELSISGIDFDFEPREYSDAQRDTVARFTAFCTQAGLSVTYCPYTNVSWWVQAQIDAVLMGGKVAQWNLQCYADGASNTPASWQPQIERNAKQMGVADPSTFIVPGVDLAGGPQGVAGSVASFRKGAPGLNGAFVWQLGAIEQAGTATVADYAQAVVNGLAPAAAGAAATTGTRPVPASV